MGSRKAPNHSKCVSGLIGANWRASSAQLACTCTWDPTSPGQAQVPALSLGMGWGEELASKPTCEGSCQVLTHRLLFMRWILKSGRWLSFYQRTRAAYHLSASLMGTDLGGWPRNRCVFLRRTLKKMSSCSYY